MLSIILPVYNAQNTLSQAIESVIRQTCDEWELFIVDDNSSDTSFDIAKRYANKNSRIHVFKNNKRLGPAATRNIGLSNVNGDYIGFIDADDQLTEDYVYKLRNAALKSHSQIIWGQFIEKKSISDEGTKIFYTYGAYSDKDKIKILNSFFSQTSGVAPVWNKIYERKFIEENNLSFNIDRVRAEDWEFNLIAFEKATSILVIPDFIYNYIRHNPFSIMSFSRIKDYELIWRSIMLLKNINNKYKIGYSEKEILSFNIPPLLETIYSIIKNNDYKDIRHILEEKRFKNLLKSKIKLSPRYKLMYISLHLLDSKMTYHIIRYLL